MHKHTRTHKITDKDTHTDNHPHPHSLTLARSIARCSMNHSLILIFHSLTERPERLNHPPTQPPTHPRNQRATHTASGKQESDSVVGEVLDGTICIDCGLKSLLCGIVVLSLVIGHLGPCFLGHPRGHCKPVEPPGSQDSGVCCKLCRVVATALPTGCPAHDTGTSHTIGRVWGEGLAPLGTWPPWGQPASAGR